MSDISEDDEEISRHPEAIQRSSTFATDNELNIEHPESPDEYEEDMEYESITPAFPHLAKKTETETVNASESIALQHLEELFSKGGITGSEMALYKTRFQLLCSLLERSRDSEFNLIQLSKRWSHQIDVDKEILAKASDFPDNINTEVARSRQSLLKLQNDQMALDERLSSMEYELKQLEDEKKMLENEVNRLPRVKHEEMILKLESSIEELKEDSIKYSTENKEMEEASKISQETLKLSTDELESINTKINSLKAKLVEANAQPLQIMKSCEKLRKEQSDADAEREKAISDYETLYKTDQNLLNTDMALTENICSLKSDYNKCFISLTGYKAQVEEAQNKLAEMIQSEFDLNEEKKQYEIKLGNLVDEKKRLYEEVKHKTHVRDKLLKELRNSEIQLKSAEEALQVTTQTHSSTEATYHQHPKVEVLIKENIEKRHKEILHRKKLYQIQETLSEVEKSKVAQSAQNEERLLYDLSDLRIEVVELTRLAQIKADEREQKAKEFIHKEKRFNNVIEELKEKKLTIEDYTRKIQEILLKRKASIKEYNVVQNERNKFANLINTATQKGSEMREKIRIFYNEIEILQTNLTHKNNLIQKQNTKYAELISMRDTLRMEVSKQKVLLRDQKEKRSQIQLDIKRLNFLSNEGEKNLMFLRGRHDNALRSRNDRAVQLIERNEEVCILQEKLNIKEQVIKSGEKQVYVREEEIDFINQNIKELNRQIDLLKKRTQEKSRLEQEVQNVKLQLSICQERQKSLELKVENPEQEYRARVLEGSDPSPIYLQDKIEELDVKIGLKDEKVMEKQLLLEAVERLTGELEKKVNSTKTDTLELAMGINEYKSQMGMIIKRLKAKTAELTMNMSESMKMEQEMKVKENALKEIYDKIENNEDVDFDVKPRKWEKLTEDTQEFSSQQYQLTNGITTTAEPRPNAYIPENEADLPIPRPYGAHAPFKPSQPGSNMRHIRKQKLKPIEI